MARRIRQVTGALPTNDENSLTRLIDTYSPYKEKTVEEYRAMLEAMDLTELHDHAISVAKMTPSTIKRDVIIRKLENLFIARENHQKQIIEQHKQKKPQKEKSVLNKKQEEIIEKWLKSSR